jgi:type IV secretion system protein VirB10
VSDSLASEDDIGPVVALPPSGPPTWLLIAGCVLAGVGLFFFVEGQRNRAAHPPPPAPTRFDNVSPSAPELQVPPPPPATPPPKPEIVYVDRPSPPVIQYVDRPAPMAAPPPIVSARLPEPALVIDLSTTDEPAQGDDAAARATILRHRSTIVPRGTIIPAVLESPIDSSAPGPVRAITSTDIRGFDGGRVLIPRGSRLYGAYRADTQAGQARVLVTWTSLVRPDGISVRLNSPAADMNGGPGVPGKVNDHRMARLASATLQSALAVGVNLASRPGNGSVIVSAPAQGVAAAGQAFLPTADARPTITVKEGADISAFLSRDLDFSGALPRE